ncbi:MAG: DUF1549 domain-containing protein [Planctomycetaceae bacterium]
MRIFWSIAVALCSISALAVENSADKERAVPATSGVPSPSVVAARVDKLILDAEGVAKLPQVDDATFLRRISFDIAGRPASPGQISRFEQSGSPNKRSETVDVLLSSDYYGENWGRYWEDAMLLRATNVRAALIRPVFEGWMSQQLAAGRGWDQIATDLLTATGKVSENGAAALMFAHEGQAEEIAAEASRLFLGVQIQCANCHDHPWDQWKREQFHQLAAFFPRVAVRRDPQSDKRADFIITSFDRQPQGRPNLTRAILTRIDRNRDGVISEDEAQGTRVQRVFRNDRVKSAIDKDGNGEVSIREILTAEPPNANRPGQGASEHYMADLSDPASKGTLVEPKFFLDGKSIPSGESDVDRRKSLATFITSPDNVWFARSIVNRMWSEMTGTAFYTPIDDIGPDRTVVHEDALNVLCDGFVASGHDLKWLIRTIAATQVYQRPMNTTAEGFVRCEPVRLRADQLYDALCQTLGTTRLLPRPNPRRGQNAPGAEDRDPGRRVFSTTFGFDPSTPQADLTGGIPETLFMMNSPPLQNFVRSNSAGSVVASVAAEATDNNDAISRIYLRTLGRKPTVAETEICRSYVEETPNRNAALEDILWSLINGSEFLCKR